MHVGGLLYKEHHLNSKTHRNQPSKTEAQFLKTPVKCAAHRYTGPVGSNMIQSLTHILRKVSCRQL